MKRFAFILGGLLLAASGWTQDAVPPASDEKPLPVSDETEVAAADALPADGGVVVVCPIEGDIEPGVMVLVERAIKEAEELGARAIVFRVDTFGGRVDSAVDIATAITETAIRSIAYIEGRGAISAGALISFACDDIIMTSGTSMGAATPVMATPEGMQPTGEKEVSFMRAKMRALAESNGHNPAIAEAMVDKDIELRGYRDETTGEYVVFAVTGTVSPDSDGPAASPGQAPTGVEDILRTLTGDQPQPAPPSEPEEIVEPTEHEPGSVVYADDSELVLPAGKLLTITPSEAMKFGVIPIIVASLDSALKQFDLAGAKLHTIEPNWAEKTFRFLTSPTIAGILMLIGLGALYFEIKTAGFGLAGIIGIIALTLLFGAHFVLGLTDTIDLVLIFAGVILIGIELFVLPGFGIAGVAGILCVLAGTYLALVNFTLPEYSWDYDRLGEVVYSMAIAAVTFAAFVFATWKLIPRTPLYGALVLENAQQVAQGYSSPVQDDLVPRVGMRGVTTSMLRPVGRARFDGTTVQVVSRGAFIPPGAEVEIIEVDGTRLVVETTETKA
jgi:membrane-bound serine protease (ClpP class)